jgi:polysaccharide export outer membrane protein
MTSDFCSASLVRSVQGAVLVALLALTGCRAYDPYSPALEPPKPAAFLPPREKSMVSLPAYRIEPPDIIQIEMLKIIPLPPYRAEVFDVLQIRAQNPLPEQPLDGYFMVEAEGTLNLGPAYGSVRVAGMTIDEVRATVEQSLGKLLKNPGVSVQLARVSGAQPVTGQYLVGPDGTVNLRQYGVVHLAGKTVTEARIAIQNHLKEYLDSPEAAVDVIAYNSKVYYVVTQGAGLGDQIRRFPITGNETALDAIAQIQGLSQVSSKHIWIARPAMGNFGCQQILPIDWDSITQGAQTGTNYQLMPGDRVYIAEDELVTFSNLIGKTTAPLERIGGILSLGNSTIRGFQTAGRAYNQNRSGF